LPAPSALIQRVENHTHHQSPDFDQSELNRKGQAPRGEDESKGPHEFWYQLSAIEHFDSHFSGTINQMRLIGRSTVTISARSLIYPSSSGLPELSLRRQVSRVDNIREIQNSFDLVPWPFSQISELPSAIVRRYHFIAGSNIVGFAEF
jgi:hypothetical protein